LGAVFPSHRQYLVLDASYKPDIADYGMYLSPLRYAVRGLFLYQIAFSGQV